MYVLVRQYMCIHNDNIRSAAVAAHGKSKVDFGDRPVFKSVLEKHGSVSLTVNLFISSKYDRRGFRLVSFLVVRTRQRTTFST